MSQTTEPRTAYKPVPPGALPITPEVAEQIQGDIAARVTTPAIMRKYHVNLQTIKVIRDGMNAATAASATPAAAAASGASGAPAPAQVATPAPSAGVPAAPTSTSASPSPGSPSPAPAPTSTPAPVTSPDETVVQGRAIELFTKGFLPSEVTAALGLTLEKTLRIFDSFITDARKPKVPALKDSEIPEEFRHGDHPSGADYERTTIPTDITRIDRKVDLDVRVYILYDMRRSRGYPGGFAEFLSNAVISYFGRAGIKAGVIQEGW